MHKITLEPKESYQVWSEDSNTSLEDLECRDHSPWTLLSPKRAEENNVVLSCGAVSQTIIGG
jgi:hypothetical protein